jgi:hypothetical protein
VPAFARLRSGIAAARTGPVSGPAVVAAGPLRRIGAPDLPGSSDRVCALSRFRHTCRFPSGKPVFDRGRPQERWRVCRSGAKRRGSMFGFAGVDWSASSTRS